MIVDLLRNDLGRIAKKVWVPKLFAVEQYRTLNQMTSTISATLKENIKIKDIFTALFPCGSVTGAPKIKTMQIIKTLEKEPRGIYTGAIGYISPKKGACFNVAIRTVALSGKKGEMGIGGGIVYDSIEKCEYREALLKAKFLIEKFPSFSLIESILWDNGYFLLGLHLRRLRKSADYFSVPLDLKKLKNDLRILGKSLNGEKFKIMVLVNLEGQIYIKKEELNQVKLPVKVKISTQRINPRNVFLYHKTTQRDLYEKERLKAQQEGFFEVIFLNTNEELTEGSISNVFLKKDKFLYTPPVKCGLLPGVLREKLLKGGKAKEKTVTLNDLLAADKIYIGNSVRGLLYAQISLADTKNKSKIKMQRITFVGKI
jgi:para-aminobenzoate synthetase/4-amino-4-deoxychorismate lyase